MCFDLVDQVLREYLDSEMVGWTGPQFAHNAPRGKPIPSCYEVKRIMAKCIISLNLYVVIFAAYIDPTVMVEIKVAELGSLSSGAKMAMKIFVKRDDFRCFPMFSAVFRCFPTVF